MMFDRDRLREEWRQLREVDWRGLELGEAGSWPLLLKWISCLLVLALALAAMYGLVVREHRAALVEARHEEQRLLSTFAAKSAEAAYLPRVQQQLATLDAKMLDLRAMLPTSAEIPSLLDSINDAAVNNRLKIDMIRLKPTVTQGYYIEHPFDIQVRGGYHQIARFVADMAALSRIVTQHDFTLLPADENGDELRLAMLARTYSYQEPPPVAEEQP